MCVLLSAASSLPKSLKSSNVYGLVLQQTCVDSETHMCMPTAAIGRPTLDPWVQPSIDLFCNTHMCVLTAAIGLPKLKRPTDG